MKYIDPGAIFDMMALTVIYFGLQKGKESRETTMTQQPHLIVIAGPNGAGKSTTAPSLLKGTLEVTEFVNADLIAQGLSGFQPEERCLFMPVV